MSENRKDYITKEAAQNQRAVILTHLKSGKPLTQEEARALYGVARLASRIDELKNRQGFPIEKIMIDTGKGTKIARYYLNEGRMKYIRPVMKGIPGELKQLRQWVCMKWQDNGPDKKPGKIPVMALNPDRKASSTDPATWASFEEAWDCYAAGHADALGFVLTENDPYTIVDLDNCLDDCGKPLNSTIKTFLNENISPLKTYTERSISGHGLHVIMKGKIPQEITGTKTGTRHGNTEMYDSGRYFVLTGLSFYNPSLPVESRQDFINALAWVITKTKNQRKEQPPASSGAAAPASTAGNAGNLANISLDDKPSYFRPCSDDEVLRKMFDSKNGGRIKALYDGDISGYGSQSEADLALCNHLSYWTNGDRAQIDRLFKSSALNRNKWEKREDYRRRTLDKAFEGAKGGNAE